MHKQKIHTQTQHAQSAQKNDALGAFQSSISKLTNLTKKEGTEPLPEHFLIFHFFCNLLIVKTVFIITSSRVNVSNHQM